MFDTTNLVFKQAGSLTRIPPHESATITNANVKTKTNVYLYPIRLFYITCVTIGKVEINITEHTKVHEVASTLKS